MCTLAQEDSSLWDVPLSLQPHLPPSLPLCSVLYIHSLSHFCPFISVYDLLLCPHTGPNAISELDHCSSLLTQPCRHLMDPEKQHVHCSRGCRGPRVWARWSRVEVRVGVHPDHCVQRSSPPRPVLSGTLFRLNLSA